MTLFTVGPVEMYRETLELSAHQLPYLRTGEFSETTLHTENLLLDLVQAPNSSRAVFLTASGTGAMEAAVINSLGSTDHALVIDGGSFGHRFTQICQYHAIPHTALHLEFGKVLTAEMLDQAYQNDMTALLINLNETSTGQLYDINMIKTFCREHDLLLIVDAISAFIADPISMEADGIDMLIISSQKALALAPGISAIVLSPRAVDRVETRTTNTMYFDLKDYLKNGARGQTPFTPAVSILLTLRQRLQSIAETGIDRVRDDIRNLAVDFRGKTAHLPVQIPSYPLSNALTPLYFPNGNASEVYHLLREQYDLTVTPSGGELGRSLLRVGHIGNLTPQDNTRLVQAMREIT